MSRLRKSTFKHWENPEIEVIFEQGFIIIQSEKQQIKVSNDEIKDIWKSIRGNLKNNVEKRSILL